MKKKKRALFRIGQKRGQVWVETIIYTLIAFALIGLVLAFVKPKIEEMQDKNLVEQSISILEDIDLILKNIGVPGNQRVIEVGINRGTLYIDAENNQLFFELESRYVYSEPGEEVLIGNVVVLTEEKGKLNDVTLTRDYSEDYDITYDDTEELKKIMRAPTPYIFTITNKGEDSYNKMIINIGVTN